MESNSYTVQKLAKGDVITLPIYGSYSAKPLGYVVITVEDNSLMATYKVLDANKKELDYGAKDFVLRLYNNLADAQSLNNNYETWGVGETVGNPGLDSKYVYLAVDYMTL